MTATPGSPASALIVHAHPEPTSFTSAAAQAAHETLITAGYTVEFLDLYAKQWAPVLARDEFPALQGPFKPQREQWDAVKAGTLQADVRAHLDALFRAELLVLSFPLWWFSLPAILKGWFDRVFVMGAVSGGDVGVFEQAALAGRRAVVLSSTGGPADAFTPNGAFGDINEFLFHINRGVLEFVGYEALAPIVTFGPAHMTEDQRAQALDLVRHAFSKIDSRTVSATSRSHLSPAPAL